MTAPGLLNWEQFLSAGVLVMVRLSSLMVFAPVFNSAAIAPRPAESTFLNHKVFVSVGMARAVWETAAAAAELPRARDATLNA